jgi:predicted ATPase
MIENISVRNFKSLKEASVPIGRITVLIGLNGSGKSSLLQAMMLLKQSLGQGGLRWDGPLVSLGNFSDVVNAHDTNAEFRISFTGRARAERGVVLRVTDYSFIYTITVDQHGFRKHDGSVLKPDSQVLLHGSWERNQQENVAQGNLGAPEGFQLGFQAQPSIGYTMVGYPQSTPQDKFSVAQEVRLAISELTEASSRAIRDTFLVPAVRGVDRPDVELADAPVNDFITVKGSEAQASNLASTLGYDPELADRVSALTKQITKVAIRQRLVPNKRTSIETLEQSFTSNLVNQGSGVNQLVFSLSQLSRAPSGSLIGIEEPELHLHPAAQSQLVDALVHVAKSENKQVVLTTHSEHILFRLLTKVVSGELTPNDLVVHRFDKKDEKTSTVTPLGIDPKGHVEGGLPGFFEEDLRDFQEYLDALSQHADKKTAR